MAEQLDDGEFWLPSQFLTDDDILSDFKSDGFGSGSSSDLGSLTSDDDDLLLNGLTRPVKIVSGSPQSTLYGWELTQQGSSHDSPTGPVKESEKDDRNQNKNATLDLLNKAAGEVAKMKLRTERSTSTSTGTGFFDCSNTSKGLFCPPQPIFTQPFYPHPHPQFRRFPPHMMWGPVQMPPQPQPQPTQQRQIQNKATKNNNTATKNNNNRPLGLPPSAWPPLPGQPQQVEVQTHTHTQAQPQKVQTRMAMYVGQQSTSVGTGVFLPRQVTVPVSEPKKKSEANVMKTKNNKASQRRNTRPVIKSNDAEIKLPSEWVY